MWCTKYVVEEKNQILRRGRFRVDSSASIFKLLARIHVAGARYCGGTAREGYLDGFLTAKKKKKKKRDSASEGETEVEEEGDIGIAQEEVVEEERETSEEFGEAPGESGGILRFVLGSLRGFVSGFSTRFAGWFRCGRKRAREGRGLKNLRPKKMRRRGSFGDIDGSSNNRRSSSSSRVNFDMVGLVCNDDTK
eukprot:g2180.t1